MLDAEEEVTIGGEDLDWVLSDSKEALALELALQFPDDECKPSSFPFRNELSRSLIAIFIAADNVEIGILKGCCFALTPSSLFVIIS